MQFKNTWKFRGACLAMCYGIFYLMSGLTNQIIFKVLFNDIIWKLTNNLVIDTILFFVMLMIPVALVHEGIHGIMYKLFGGKVRFSIRGIYLQAREASKLQMSRSKYLVVLMTPVVILSSLSLLIPGWIGSTILLLNLFKSTGDMIKAAYLCRAKNDSFIVDNQNGFEIVDKQTSVQLTFENL